MQISLKDVSADYQIGPMRNKGVIKDLSLELPAHSFTAVVGHTGAGKSSLLKLLNGLLQLQTGTVTVGDTVLTPITSKEKIKKVRQHVGMVFQFPESQLFAETVEKDIAFGPINFGLPKLEAYKRAAEMAELVGLDARILKKSPFSLSGGQQRRAAIAGVLATNPDVLVLDEPGAGLDPEGKREILTMIKRLHSEKKMTTVLVTHDMEDVSCYAEDVVVMKEGKVAAYQPVKAFFTNIETLVDWKIGLPEPRRFQLRIEAETGRKLPWVCLTMDELVAALIEVNLV